MRKVNVLLFNFSVENTMEPLADGDTLYTIYTGKKLKDVKLLYGSHKFDYIFLRASPEPAGDFHNLDYFRDVYSYAKIIAFSEKPGFKAAFQYIKHGAHDFRRGSGNFFNFRNILETCNHGGNGKTPVNGSVSGGNNLLLACAAITNGVLSCFEKVQGRCMDVKHLNAVGQYSRLLAEKYGQYSGNTFSPDELEYITHITVTKY